MGIFQIISSLSSSELSHDGSPVLSCLARPQGLPSQRGLQPGLGPPWSVEMQEAGVTPGWTWLASSGTWDHPCRLQLRPGSVISPLPTLSAAAAAAGHPPHQPLRELETHQGQDEPLHGAGDVHRSTHTSSETAADGLSCLESPVLYREAVTPPYLLTSIFHYHHAHPRLQGFLCILGHEDFEEFVSLARRSGEKRAAHVFDSEIKVLPSDKRPALITAKRGVTQTSP